MCARTSDTLAVRGHRPVVLAAPAVVGVATSPRVSHLEVLAGHVRADEVAVREVAGEHRQQGLAARARLVGRREPPVRQQLVLVRLHPEHALLAAADAVELGVLAQVGGGSVVRGRVVRWRVVRALTWCDASPRPWRG